MRSHCASLAAAAALVLTLGLPLSVEAQPPAPPPQPDPCTPGSSPNSILHLQELAENGSKLPLPFGTEAQDVDINSTIRIEICRDNFARWIDSVPALRSPEATDVRFLLDSSAELRKSADFLKAAIADGARIANLIADGGDAVRSTPEFASLAQSNLSRQTESRKIVRKYWETLEASTRADFRNHVRESREASNAALLNGPFAYYAFMIEEIRWTLDELKKAQDQLAAHPPAAALVLAAARVQDGKLTDVGLPNYSSLPIGEPQRFEKVTLVASPEEMAQIEAAQKEFTELAAVLNNLLDGKAELEEAVRKLLAVRGIDLDKLQTALKKVEADVAQLRAADWRQIGEDLESRLEAVLQETLTQAERDLLDGNLRSQIEDLQARTREFQSSLAGLVLQARALSAEVGEGEVLAQDPAAALSSLMSLVQAGTALAGGGGNLLDQLLSGVAAADQLAKGLKADAAEVRETLNGLKASLRTRILEALSTAATDQLGQLSTDLAALRTAARETGEQIRDLFRKSEGTINLAAALDREPPATSHVVAFENLIDTSLDLQTLRGRQEGDTVVLQAWLYRIERSPENPQEVIRREEIVRIDQPFRMMRFGFYSGPAAGLVYLRGAEKLEGQTEETRAFAPQVSWLLHYRPWRQPPAAGQPLEPFRATRSWHDYVSAGLHTMSLDLDRDNQQEIGFGVSLSLLGGYLQLGGGVDLSLNEELYFFVGTRLFDLLRNPGVKNK